MRNAPSYESSYIQSYDINNADATLAGSFLQKSHWLLEKPFNKDLYFDRVLEVGAGSGHHLPFVRHGYGEYVMTDANDAMLKIAEEKYKKKILDHSLVLQWQDATSLQFPDNAFDRLIATHVLEHLPNPVAVLGEWNRVVKPGGTISIVLPCDPGFLWRFGRMLGPRRNAIKLGIEYDYLQSAEHINSIYNLVVFIQYHFENISESWYPARLPYPDLNLFYICNIKK